MTPIVDLRLQLLERLPECPFHKFIPLEMGQRIHFATDDLTTTTHQERFLVVNYGMFSAQYGRALACPRKGSSEDNILQQ